MMRYLQNLRAKGFSHGPVQIFQCLIKHGKISFRNPVIFSFLKIFKTICSLSVIFKYKEQFRTGEICFKVALLGIFT